MFVRQVRDIFYLSLGFFYLPVTHVCPTSSRHVLPFLGVHLSSRSSEVGDLYVDFTLNLAGGEPHAMNLNTDSLGLEAAGSEWQDKGNLIYFENFQFEKIHLSLIPVLRISPFSAEIHLFTFFCRKFCRFSTFFQENSQQKFFPRKIHLLLI